MRNKAALALCVLALMVPARRAAAVEPVPGDSCAGGGIVANSFQWAGAPENSGVTNGMFCESNTWLGVITFKSSGNVGIGTTSPASLLDVEGTANYPLEIGTTYNGGGSNYTGALLALNPTLAAGHTYFAKVGRTDSANNVAYFGFTYNSAGSATNYATIGLYAADRILNITGGGNVGIGTTAPGAFAAASHADDR